MYTYLSIKALILPFRSFISPPTSCRRGQQTAKNHRSALFVFTIAIIVFAERVLVSFLFWHCHAISTYDNC